MSGSMDASAGKGTWWQAALMIRGQTKVDQRNIRSVWIWCLVWALSFAAATTLLEALPQLRSAAWLLAVVSIALSVPALLANIRFVREADEFMRKVQLHGIAIGFATAFVFCMGYHMFEQLGAPHLSMIYATLPLGFGWAIGSFIVAYRHR